MAASKKLATAAVLVSLLALLVGPSAGLLDLCPVFVGWGALGSLLNSLICGIPGGNYTPPTVPSNPPTGKELSFGYYNNRSNTASYCPDAEAAVTAVVEKAIKQQGRGVGAGLIRLFFHDAFVRGCDASVLLNRTVAAGSNTEREGPPNKDSLRGFDVIDAAKEATKAACGGRNVVSCADILAFAARDASDILSNGSIKFAMPAGRFDGRESFARETNQLPGPDSTLEDLVRMFKDQGLSEPDMVTLSGAHSIGRARCLFLTDDRLSAMNSTYARQLKAACTRPDTRVDQDPFTPNTLDNRYYENIDKFVLFKSDAVLLSSETAKKQVKDNAANATKWEADFAAAMVKMGNIGVKTTQVPRVTEIREVCWRVNDA